MKKRITGVHHIALKCNSPEEYARTIAFYTELLGLSVKRKWGDNERGGIMLDAGNALIEIFPNADDRLGQGTIRHFALGTDCVDEVINVIRNAGYKVTEEPHDIVIRSEIPFPARIAFIIGPVGEEIEIFQET